MGASTLYYYGPAARRRRQRHAAERAAVAESHTKPSNVLLRAVMRGRDPHKLVESVSVSIIPADDRKKYKTWSAALDDQGYAADVVVFDGGSTQQNKADAVKYAQHHGWVVVNGSQLYNKTLGRVDDDAE